MSKLPYGWQELNDPSNDGRRYFVTPGPLQGSTWVHPLSPINENNPLPRGWECRFDMNIRWCYFNKHTKTITYEDPRLPQLSPRVRLPRGNILSDIWFYGEIPPSTYIAPDSLSGTLDSEPPPAYSTLSDLPAASITSATVQLPPIQQEPQFNSNITLPGIASLALPRPQPPHDPDTVAATSVLLAPGGCNSPTQAEPEHKQLSPQSDSLPEIKTPTRTDGSDDRPPRSQLQSDGSQTSLQTNSETNNKQQTPPSKEQSADIQPISLNISESNSNQLTPPSEEESTEIEPLSQSNSEPSRTQCTAEPEDQSTNHHPTTKFEPMNKNDDDSLATFPKDEGSDTGGCSTLTKNYTATQLRREKRKLQKQHARESKELTSHQPTSNSEPKNDGGESVATSPKNKDAETSDGSVVAKDLTETQLRRKRRKHQKKSIGKPVMNAAGAANHSSLPTKFGTALPSKSNHVVKAIRRARTKLFRANRDPSGLVHYEEISDNCRASRFAPHWYRLHWDNGGLHHSAIVYSGLFPSSPWERELDSWCNGTQSLDDVRHLFIKFPNRNKHDRGPVNYTDTRAILYRGRTCAVAIRMGIIKKRACHEACTRKPISLAQEGHTSVGEEGACAKLLSMVETRVSAEEAGLFLPVVPRVRKVEEALLTKSLSLRKTRTSAEEAGLLEWGAPRVRKVEEASFTKPLSVMKTRVSAEEAGLFEREAPRVRKVEEAASTNPLSAMKTRTSAEEAGLFEREAPQVQGDDEPADAGSLSMRRGVYAEEAVLFESEAPQVHEDDERVETGSLSMRRGISAEEAGLFE
jgi:hypothetical protein